MTYCREIMIPSKPIAVSILVALVLALFSVPEATAQLQEPEVIDVEQPRTLYGEGLRSGLAVNAVVNNFGIGMLGQYSRVVSPFTELTLTAGITGIRDVREQSFQNFFTGRRTVPNKYNRALGFPIMVGVKQRMFARHIADNFRVFISTAAGPAMSFVYPYFNDIDDNGLRNVVELPNGVRQAEPLYDFFTGWDQGETKWGLSAEFKIGIDFGDNFSNLTRVEFGYFFYYFDQGIQMMEPHRGGIMRAFDAQGEPIPFNQTFYDAQKFFGTPQITITFGTMW